jgi:hypothetical protein
MKRTALGALLGLALFSQVAPAPAQAPSGSAHRAKPPHAHPGGSGAPGGSAGRPPKPFGMMPTLGSGMPGGSAHPGGPPMHPGLHKRMMERLASLKERRSAHVGQLRARFSELHLQNQALKNELRRHARSLAFLTRARMVAEEELTEPKKAKVLKRIDVLLAKEQARHDRHVTKFTGVGPAASGSAPPFASGSVPPGKASGAAAPAGSGAPKPKPSPAPAASAGGAS